MDITREEILEELNQYRDRPPHQRSEVVDFILENTDKDDYVNWRIEYEKNYGKKQLIDMTDFAHEFFDKALNNFLKAHLYQRQYN